MLIGTLLLADRLGITIDEPVQAKATANAKTSAVPKSRGSARARHGTPAASVPGRRWALPHPPP